MRLSLLAGLVGVGIPAGDLAARPEDSSVGAGARASADDGLEVVVRSSDDGAEGDGVVVVRSGTAEHVLQVRTEDGRLRVSSPADPDRAWLGVLLSPESDGVHVTSVMEGSPADRAGLRAGDVIVRVGSRDVTGDHEQDALLAGRRPGDLVRLEVIRDGERVSVVPELGSHPGEVVFDVAEGVGAIHVAPDVLGGIEGLSALQGLKALPRWIGLTACEDDDEDCLKLFGTAQALAFRPRPRLGVVLESLSDQLAEFFEVEPGTGQLVKEVLPDTPAQRAGLKAGDVIVRIDDLAVTSVEDVRQALDQVEDGEVARVEVMRRGRREAFDAELDSPVMPSLQDLDLDIDLDVDSEALERLKNRIHLLQHEAQRAAASRAESASRFVEREAREARQQAEEALRRAQREMRRSLEERARDGARDLRRLDSASRTY